MVEQETLVFVIVLGSDNDLESVILTFALLYFDTIGEPVTFNLKIFDLLNKLKTCLLMTNTAIYRLSEGVASASANA